MPGTHQHMHHGAEGEYVGGEDCELVVVPRWRAIQVMQAKLVGEVGEETGDRGEEVKGRSARGVEEAHLGSRWSLDPVMPGHAWSLDPVMPGHAWSLDPVMPGYTPGVGGVEVRSCP